MPGKRTVYDSPWKQILETYFKEFLAFFFPAVHDGVDWDRKPEFLDKELEQLTPEAATGRRRVDKLIKVWWIDGEETWLLIHIEVQSQVDTSFAERMFVYAYRLFDHHHLPVVSLAVLGDTNAKWRPREFSVGKAGSHLTLHFPIVKLTDYWDQWAELEASNNPFAVVVMAHLQAQATKRTPNARLDAKLALIRRLLSHGIAPSEVKSLFRFIDWVLQIPDELKPLYRKELAAMAEIQYVPYISGIERDAMKKGYKVGKKEGKEEGKQEGRHEGLVTAIELGLRLKFGDPGLALLPEIAKTSQTQQLERILGALMSDASLEDLQRMVVAVDS